MSLIFQLQKCVKLYDKIIEFSVYYIRDVLLLLVRVYMASVFFQAGWNKLENALDDKWFKTVFLFKLIHPVPFLSPHTAAVLGTGAEIVFPVLLALGIMARIGALGLLAVTAVITFMVHSHFTHIFWGLLLSVSFVMGPGRFALDGWLRARWDQLYVS